MKTVTFLILCSLLYVALEQSCPTSYTGDYLQSGKKSVTNFGKDLYTTSTIILFNSPISNPQICASLSSIDSYRPDLAQGFSFSIKPKNGNIRRFISIDLQIVADNSWKEATVRYLINGRLDMFVGNFKVDYKTPASVTQNQVAQYSLGTILPQNNYNVAVFISGLKFVQKIDVKISNAKFNASSNKIEINFVIKHLQFLERVQFGFIVFPSSHQFLQMKYVSPPTETGSYDISGVTRFNENNSFEQGEWKILNRYIKCEGQCQNSNCIRIQQCTSSQGVISGDTCKICLKNNQGKCINETGSIPNPPTVDSCPPRSQLNLITFQCQCLFGDEYLIDGKCVKCQNTSIFNGRKCVCRSNFFQINGKCRTCDPRSTYDRSTKDCLCNLGFYGNRDLCEPCHVSCSKCTGPQASECTTCVDITYTLQNGFCNRKGPCPPGSYLGSNGQCEQCSQYCNQCQSLNKCLKCAIGFKLLTQTFQGQTFSFCEQICGDGRRFAQDCDDGNNINNDGCSSQCLVESGWFCTNSSSLSKSICQQIAGQKVVVQSKAAVNLGNRVLHSINIPYLPECINKDQCLQCFKAIKVSVIESIVPIQVYINYVVNSKHQFIIEYNFGQLFVSSAFVVSVKLNNDFSKCLSPSQLDQVYTAKIDPATLNCNQIQQTLNINNLQIEDIPQSCFKQFQFTNKS